VRPLSISQNAALRRGLGLVAAVLLATPLTFAATPSAHGVPSVSDPRMASVLASVREPARAAARQVGAGTPGSPVTPQDFEDIAAIDASVLETPLDATEQDVARDTLVSQYRRSPQAFAKGVKIEHQLAQILLHGSPSEQMQARTIAWLGWIEAAPGNPLTTRWVATVRRHDVPVVSANVVIVTNRQIDALFVSNDWVAHAANLPPSTAESRAAFTESLPGRFGSMSQAERQQIALADLRWDALRGVLQFGLQEKAVSIARMNVHGSSDVDAGARHLEDAALEFDRGVQQLNKQVSDRAIALMGGVGDGAVAESINSAQDRFEGKFDADRHH
jgi:hypothetical protein